MKKGELKVVAIILLIIILIFAWAVIWKNTKNKQENKNNMQIKNEVKTSQEEFVQTQSDGTKANISNELKKDKIIDGLTIKNIKLETKANETILTAIVENLSSKAKGDYGINIIAKDKAGNILKKIAGYINLTQAKDKTTLRIKTSFDFANTYNIEIEKQ